MSMNEYDSFYYFSQSWFDVSVSFAYQLKKVVGNKIRENDYLSMHTADMSYQIDSGLLLINVLSC